MMGFAKGSTHPTRRDLTRSSSPAPADPSRPGINRALARSLPVETQSRVQGEQAMSDHDHHDDKPGVSRRKVLECMTWAGTGVLWTISGGVPRSLGLVDSALAAEPAGLTFLQISDLSLIHISEPTRRTPISYA